MTRIKDILENKNKKTKKKVVKPPTLKKRCRKKTGLRLGQNKSGTLKRTRLYQDKSRTLKRTGNSRTKIELREKDKIKVGLGRTNQGQDQGWTMGKQKD